MKTQIFGSAYAQDYDLFYKDKDYESECDLIEEFFRRHAEKPIKSILDMGCGTGNHAIPLMRRGFDLTGVDCSAEMIEQAQIKARTQYQLMRKAPRLIHGDIRELALEESFDAVIMMFAVLGYQFTNADFSKTLHTVRRHLKPGGLFVFDVWYGPAVLAIRPGDKIKEIATSNGKVIRMASGRLDVARHLCQVDYRHLKISGNYIKNDSSECHTMRYFFPMELDMALSFNGLGLRSLTAFPHPDKPADETTWNAMGLAIARGSRETQK